MKKIFLFILSLSFLICSCNNSGDITGSVGDGGNGNPNGPGGGSGGGTQEGDFIIPQGGLSQAEQRKNLDPNISTEVLFKKGNYSSSYFRIPALIVTKKGIILAATDRRYTKTADVGKSSKIDVIVRRSEDLGNSWSDYVLVGPGAKEENGSDAYGDAFFINCHNGDVILGVIKNPGIQQSQKGETVLYRSSDDGKTWKEAFSFGPESEIFKAYKADKGFGASGQGLTLRYGENASKNRLMFAFFQWNKNGAGGGGLSVSAIRSDDDGTTWRNVGNIKPNNPDNNIDETKAIELSDGTIMFNHRRGVNVGQRNWSRSSDAGATWISQGLDPEVNDPGNNADFVRYEINGKRIKTEKYILMINSNVPKGGSWFRDRKNHYVRLTKNEFQNGNGTQNGKYDYQKQLVNGGESLYSGYPTIAVLPDGTIGTLTEETRDGTVQDAYDIVWRRFNLFWLSGGKEYVDYINDWAFQN